VIREQNPCMMCKRLTRKLLFNDSKLCIHMCSYECERKYLDTLSTQEEAKLLARFDHMRAQIKHRLRTCWITAGLSLMVILVGFLTRTPTIFIVGASLATVCAFLTRYFEDKTVKLTRIRERISV